MLINSDFDNYLGLQRLRYSILELFEKFNTTNQEFDLSFVTYYLSVKGDFFFPSPMFRFMYLKLIPGPVVELELIQSHLNVVTNYFEIIFLDKLK